MPAMPLHELAQQPAHVARLITYFEKLSPDQLGQLGAYYSAQARFKDPFNEVRGLAPLRQVFEHMYHALEKPRFVVTAAITQDRQCFLTWDFEFYFKRFDTANLQTVRGGSHLVFTPDGLVELHRDYWDAAEELYEKLPVIGGAMRWLKRRART